jgi:deoxyribose-phosphate aldolase
MNIAGYIEHTNLSPTLTIGAIDKLVEEAKQHNFFGICVPPFWVKRYNMTETKLDEIKRAIDNGADEIDVVWNITSFKTGIPWTKIEIAKCSKLVHDHQKLLKVIIETAYLSDTEIVEACKLCSDAGVDFVKTSTGFAPTGATVEHVALMKKSLPDSVGIKASGGIKNQQQTLALIQAGASRIGTSSGVSIVNQSNNQP